MPLPNLTPEQRQQALDKANAVRHERAELKDQLKKGGTAATFSAVRSPGTTLTTRRCSGSNATWSQ